MASAAGTNDLLKSLQNTVNCSVCRDIFTDPLTLHCGHNFCRTCITQRWEGLKRNFPCPQCRKRFQERHMRPNPQLEEIAKQVRSPAVKGSEGEKLCETHKKPLNLYCVNQKEVICVDCHMSDKHRECSVLPVEDALKHFKNEIHGDLQNFKNDEDRMLVMKANEEKKIDALLTQTATERKEITAYFGQHHRILNSHEWYLTNKLIVADRVALRKQNDCFVAIFKKIPKLEKLISDTEKCQQPATEFLKDVQSTLKSLDSEREKQKTMLDPMPISSYIGTTFHDSEVFKVCKELLMPNKVYMTLNKRSSEPGAENNDILYLLYGVEKQELIVSVDGRSVTWKPGSTVSDSLKGFDPSCYVLGSEGFTSGRHYWEVEVGKKREGEWLWYWDYDGEEEWAIGVASESMTHKTPSDLIPEEGIWCVWMSQDTIHPSYWGPHYQTPAITAAQKMNLISASSEAPLDQTPATTPAPVESDTPPALAPPTTVGSIAPGPMTLDGQCHGPTKLQFQNETVIRIRVCLDYEKGWVTFYRTDNMAVPITYCTSFTEKIFPIFWVCSQGTCLRLCP